MPKKTIVKNSKAPPQFDPTQGTYDITSLDSEYFIKFILKQDQGQISLNQIAWLASLPLNMIDDPVDLFQWIIKNELSSVIPCQRLSFLKKKGLVV